jgi:ankyrin repeat protein
MKFKAIFFFVVFILLVGFTVRQEQVIAAETQQGYAKVDYRGLELPPPRVKKTDNDEYKFRNKRQNFALLNKKSDRNFKHVQFIKVAAIGNFKELQFLYEEKKPRVNFRNKNGETALIKVLDGPYNEDTFSKLKFLISAGVKLNVRGKSSKSENTSSLGVAIYNSKAVFQSGNAAEVQIAQQILELLIREGAAVSSLEVNGRSLLHLAAATNNLFAAKLLLESGAKVIPMDDYHKTPLDIAESGEMIQLLKKYQVKELS